MYKFFLFSIPFFLVACGGGSSSTSPSTPSTPLTPSTPITPPITTNTSSVNIDEAFSGLRTSATLSPVLAREVASDVLFFEDFIINLFLTNSFVGNEEIVNESRNETETCPSGGSLNLRIRNVNSIGISEFTFDDCIIEGVTITGSYILEYDFNTSLSELELRNYRITNQINQSILLNGTVNENNNQTLIANLLRESETEQLLVKDLILDVPFLDRGDAELPVYGGTFFYSDSGKVDLNINRRFTSNTLPVDYFAEGALLNINDSQGNSSSFQFINSEGEALGSSSANSFGINDGNAIIEVSFLSEENSPSYGRVTLDNLLTIPEIGLQPIANEVLSANNQSLQYSNTREIRSLENGIKFDGRNSSDPEGALLTYDWEIIELPVGSNAQLDSTNSISPTLSIDYLGVYKVQMIVSDGTLLSDPKIIIVEVGGSQFNPLESFGGLSWNARQLDGSFSEGPTFNPITTLDIDLTPNSIDIPDFLQFDVEWNITDQPSSLTVDLLDIDSRVSRFIPNQTGQYTIEAITNNGFSTFRDTITIDILDFDKSVTPKVLSRPRSNQFAFVDFEKTLNLEYRVEVGSNEYTNSITLVDKPTNSIPQAEIIVNQSEEIFNQGLVNPNTILNFKFDQPGRYIYEISATNGDHDIMPMSFVFDVYDGSIAPLIEDSFSSEISSNPNSESINIESMEMADIDNDGINDFVIVYTNRSGGAKYQILYGQSDQTYTKSELFDAPSDQLLSLSDINNDSDLELVFRGNALSTINNDSNISIVPLTTSVESINDPNILPFSDMPIDFDSSYFVHSLSDINNDGLKDVILLKKGDINNNSTFEGIAYSLQSEDNFFTSLVKVPVSNLFIWEISHDEINNSLLVVSGNASSISNNDFQDTLLVDEFKFQQATLNLDTTKIISYLSDTPFGGNFQTDEIVDLDGDGIKEIIGTSNVAGFISKAIWKKNNINNNYEEDQKFSLRASDGLRFFDMDSDGDIDMVSNSNILYQDENNQFTRRKVVEFDDADIRSILPFVFDVDNDGDFDMISIFNFSFEELTPNIKILRNTTN